MCQRHNLSSFVRRSAAAAAAWRPQSQLLELCCPLFIHLSFLYTSHSTAAAIRSLKWIWKLIPSRKIHEHSLRYFVLTFLPRCMQCRRGLAMRILSVRLSVKRVLCDKTVERSVQIYTPYERTFSLVFWEEEWLVGGDPFYLKFWVNRPPLEQNRRFWTDNRS